MRHQTIIVVLTLFSIAFGSTSQLMSDHLTKESLEKISSNSIESKGTKQEGQYSKPSTHRGETRRDKERGSGRISISDPSSKTTKSMVVKS
ncbi:MAG: hypothetical protein ACOC0N_02730 [Chroococcales cyanobacterium]